MTCSTLDWLQQEVKPQVDARIKSALQDHEYYERLWYQFSTGGKRWRPGLTLLVGRICGVPNNKLLDLAAGIETLHTFTLIHDDILDRDRYRRDEPTVWMKYGEASAVNIGDMLTAKALTLIPEAVVSLAHNAILEITEGQQMDLDFENRRDVTIDEYMMMGQKNTGTLFDLCVEAPQMMTDTELGMDNFSKLGCAFRIRDDLLEFEAGKGKKQIGNEIRVGKRTLMVIHADDDRLYDILDKSREETTEQDIERAQEIMREHNSIEFAQNKMEDLAEEALASLSNLPESEERTRILELGSFLIKRNQ